MRYRTMVIGALTGIIALGCEPPEQDFAPGPGVPNDTVQQDTLTQADREAYRGEVEQALERSRERMDELGTRIADDTEEGWQNLSQRAQETWDDVEASMDNIRDGTQDDVRESREEIANRLAELEASMAAREVEAAQDRERLREFANEHLNELESDLAQIQQYQMQRQDDAFLGIGELDVENARERIQDMRMELDELAQEADQEDFENRREDLRADIEDLTQDIRQERYEAQWTGQVRA